LIHTKFQVIFSAWSVFFKLCCIILFKTRWIWTWSVDSGPIPRHPMNWQLVLPMRKLVSSKMEKVLICQKMVISQNTKIIFMRKSRILQSTIKMFMKLQYDIVLLLSYFKLYINFMVFYIFWAWWPIFSFG